MVTSDESRFSRMDEVKFVDKKLLKIFGVIYYLKYFKVYLPQSLIDLFFTTLTHTFL